MCLGKHILKSYSTTQSVIAQSSGEAEYYGLTKGASVGIGIQGMFIDFGLKFKLEVFTLLCFFSFLVCCDVVASLDMVGAHQLCSPLSKKFPGNLRQPGATLMFIARPEPLDLNSNTRRNGTI